MSFTEWSVFNMAPAHAGVQQGSVLGSFILLNLDKQLSEQKYSINSQFFSTTNDITHTASEN